MLLDSLATLFLASTISAAVLSNRQVCQQIAGCIDGTVYYPTVPLSANFVNDTAHFMASSSQTPSCVVEVANPKDVSTVLKIVGETRTPFAVKSGGHASNPGFSSTPGVFISLVRMKQVTLSADKSTAEIGLGNLWTEAYAKLQGSGVNVAGGRVVGPGTGGFSLGCGYNWFANQYGLTCDTTLAYSIVLPNGTITKVDSAQLDLFFALKGGLNRFGVVTSIIYKTHPQTDVYGGVKSYGTNAIQALINAVTTFQKENQDPKAQAIFALDSGGVAPGAILLIFYDGPTKPAAFAPFDAVDIATPPLDSNVKSQTFASFSLSAPSDASTGYRGAFHVMPTIGLTTAFLNAVANETTYYGNLAPLHSANQISYNVEPFGNYGVHATDSAFPHANSPLPLNLYYAWESESDDEFWRATIQRSVDYLTEVAKAEGIYTEDAYAYPNYALDTYTGTQLYGPTNAARLRKIQAKYDPNRVMLLAGGFTI